MKVLSIRMGTLGVCLLVFASWAMAQSTPEKLVANVLKALEARDSATLRRLAIPESDVKKLVWPTVAATVGSSNMNSDKFAALYIKTSEVGIAEQLEKFGGLKLELVTVSLAEPKKQSQGFRLLPAPLVTLRDETGSEKAVRLIGGILERDGAFKVATYYISQANR